MIVLVVFATQAPIPEVKAGLSNIFTDEKDIRISTTNIYQLPPVDLATHVSFVEF